MRLRECAALSALLFGAFIWSACDDNGSGGFVGSGSPRLVLGATSFNFVSQVAGNPEQTQDVTLSNEGDADLLLANIAGQFINSSAYTLTYEQSSTPGEWRPGISPTGNSLNGSVLTIPPGESLTFRLAYMPDGIMVGTMVRFASNDMNRPTVELPVQSNGAGAELLIIPGAVDFGRVAAGEQVTKTVRVLNVGSAVADVSVLTVSGSPDFSVAVRGVDPRADITVLDDPDQDGSAGLSPTQEFEIDITYAPPMEGPDEGALLVGNIDNQVSVPLLANGASPCINLLFPGSASANNNELQFGPSLIGATRTQEVIVESCGGQTLVVSNVRLEGSPVYGQDAMPPIELPASSVTGTPTSSFNVTFSPTDAEVYEGTLIVESNDALRPVIEIPIIGRGSLNACPVAAVRESEMQVLPLEIITLDAGLSVDPDGPGGLPLSFEWTGVQRPMGSTAQPVERFSNPLRPADGGPVDNPSTPQAQFFVDLAGEYVISLLVRDELGFEAPSGQCPQPEATIYINSLPDEDIHVELVWHTPNDPDETDENGTDVDLHFMHPNGINPFNGIPNTMGWDSSPYDCYYANKNPDWGPAGAVGNPSLDIDDTNGAGPENINLDAPDFTGSGSYRVGVHYFTDGGFGPSDATVRVYLFGVIEGEWTRRLNRTGNFWEVAGIIWTQNDKRVQEINRFYEFTP